MKKMLILLVLAATALPGFAQKPEYEFEPQKRLPEYEFKLPDSLSHMTPWLPALNHPDRINPLKPAVSMTSLTRPAQDDIPRRVSVISDGILRTKHLTISNGQAWNWSPFPDAYLDARTLSMPMPR